jgi:hypothetical protein
MYFEGIEVENTLGLRLILFRVFASGAGIEDGRREKATICTCV